MKAPKLQPVSSPLLIEAIARSLREQIVSGVLEPGRRLSEREIGALLGVSRTPLREALRLLAGERLVEVLPRRGARVALLDTAVVEEVYPVMACLERLAIDLACRHVRDDELRELAELMERMKAARKAGSKPRFFAASGEFHDRILVAAGNATLREQHRQLAGRVRRAQFMSLASESEWTEALREHAQILDALRKRNASAAVEAVKRHVDTRKKKVLRTLSETD